MKILQLLPELNEGGVERGTVELAREFVKQGLESVVISNGGKLVAQLEDEGSLHVKVNVSSKNPFTAPWRIWKLYKAIKKIQPDLLHVRSRVPAWMVYFANKFLNLPFMTTVHGLNSVNRYSKIMSTGEQVICVSSVVKDYIIKNYGTNPDKITVIERGVDMHKFNPATVDTIFIDDFKTRFNLHDSFIVTSVGRITWLKDYESFIEAIALAKKAIPNIKGVIVGGAREDKQEYLQSLKDLAKSLHVKDNIIFTGSQAKMAEIYYLSDGVVNASLKMGNVGRTVTEALAMDTPVLATTYEGLTDTVQDDINGYIIQTKDPKNLSEQLIRLHQANLQNIREKVNPDFTLTNMVSSTIKVYETLLRTHQQ